MVNEETNRITQALLTDHSGMSKGDGLMVLKHPLCVLVMIFIVVFSVCSVKLNNQKGFGRLASCIAPLKLNLH